MILTPPDYLILFIFMLFVLLGFRHGILGMGSMSLALLSLLPLHYLILQLDLDPTWGLVGSVAILVVLMSWFVLPTLRVLSIAIPFSKPLGAVYGLVFAYFAMAYAVNTQKSLNEDLQDSHFRNFFHWLAPLSREFHGSYDTISVDMGKEGAERISNIKPEDLAAVAKKSKQKIDYFRRRIMSLINSEDGEVDMNALTNYCAKQKDPDTCLQKALDLILSEDANKKVAEALKAKQDEEADSNNEDSSDD